ncbi:O-antigen ligase [Flammeovirga sp. OC4]|uniref:O-antigen ligase family protein n=1 Tax=Flammeovirga sp. OC4 TaxID=1382345 RepID=UPI00155DD2C1|nr:O-antigen ligase family protein [Flammeovirga sp. OC4]
MLNNILYICFGFYFILFWRKSNPLKKEFILPIIPFIASFFLFNETTFTKIEVYFTLLIIPVILLLNKNKNELKIYFINTSFFYSILSLSIAIFNYFFVEHRWGIQTEFFFYKDLSSNIFDVHPVYLSISIGIALILSIQEYANKPKYLIPITVLLLFYLLLLNSRTVTVYILVVLLAIILKRNFKVAILFISILFIFGMLIMSKQKMPNRNFNVFEAINLSDEPVTVKDNGLSIRLRIWKYSLTVVCGSTKNLILGVGIGNGKNELSKIYKENDEIYLYEKNLGAHNQYISFILELGLFGFVFILICFAYVYNYYIKNKNYEAIIISSLFLIVFNTEAVLNRNYGLTIFTYFTYLYLPNKK